MPWFGSRGAAAGLNRAGLNRVRPAQTQAGTAEKAAYILAGYVAYESTRMLYDGPMAVLLSTFDLMLGYGKMMLTPGVLGTLLLGGIIGGVLTEWGGRRWR